MSQHGAFIYRQAVRHNIPGLEKLKGVRRDGVVEYRYRQLGDGHDFKYLVDEECD